MCAARTAYPLRLGHEWCGRVVGVAADVHSAWIGRRVMGDTMIGDDTCRRCTLGHQHVCEHRTEVGIRKRSARRAGRTDRRTCLVPGVLPDALDSAAGALVEPGGSALRTARATQAGNTWTEAALPQPPFDAVVDASTPDTYRRLSGPLVAATVGLEQACSVLAGEPVADAGPGPKIHVDPHLA